MTLAAAATSSSGTATTISAMIPPVTNSARYGVRKRVCTAAKKDGSMWSRPSAKAMRVEENVTAFSADSVDSNPPIRMITVP